MLAVRGPIIISVSVPHIVVIIRVPATNHEKAVSLMEETVNRKKATAITSECVFDETLTVVLFRSKSLISAVKTGDLIKESFPG